MGTICPLIASMQKALDWKLVDDIAATLGAEAETRRKWRQRDSGVPQAWRIKIVEALARDGHTVSFAAFDDLPQNPGRIAA